MVQDGVECERCGGNGGHTWMETIAGGMDEHGDPVPMGQRVEQECLTCKGTGKTPISNADLDALGAKWIYGYEVKYLIGWWYMKVGPGKLLRPARGEFALGWRWEVVTSYTTDPPQRCD